nr:MAG TPA: hypothetical protein [Caudoviricetes sp.]
MIWSVRRVYSRENKKTIARRVRRRNNRLKGKGGGNHENHLYRAGSS